MAPDVAGMEFIPEAALVRVVVIVKASLLVKSQPMLI